MKSEDKPYVENYPPLYEWLCKHSARCMWQTFVGDKSESHRAVESWLVGKGVVILSVLSHKRGWSIYSEPDTINVAEVFADAEKRCGVSS